MPSSTASTTPGPPWPPSTGEQGGHRRGLSPDSHSEYHPADLPTLEDFLALDVRVGTIVSARTHRGSRIPALLLTIDFGEAGTREVSTGIRELYDVDQLVGLQVVGIVNVPGQAVAGVQTGAAILTVGNGRGESVLLMPDRPVPDGTKVGA